MPEYRDEREPVPTYLWQAIVVTILCCLPLGIPAIVHATRVNSLLVQGDRNGAWEAANKAKTWCWIAFGVGFAVQALQLLFWLALMLLPLANL